jgi:hypothetical protein
MRRNRRNLPTVLAAPAKDFGQPGGSMMELEEGKRRGEWGPFIGVTRC